MNPLRFARHLGIPQSGHHAGEQLLATLGGAVGIGLILVVTHRLLGPEASVLIVPSMGASAVIVFAAPHSVFAQPWAVLGGHLISAVIGVACQRWVPNPVLAAALAVGLAIGAMHLARCLHPPGGATALAAVIGGPAVTGLGFHYVLAPVGLNCLIILLAGIAFNYPFAWRRYPVSLMKYAFHRPAGPLHELDEGDIRAAMDRLNVVVDTTPAELHEIYHQAMAIRHPQAAARVPDVKLGRYYCNEQPGQQWSVRQIVDERPSDIPEFDVVIYRVVDGQGLNRYGNCTRSEFAAWAKSEFRPVGASAGEAGRG